MSKKNDGGPAFPSHGSMGEVAHEGMTLRDYFAAKAMAATQISEVMEAFRRNDYGGRQAHNTYLPLNDDELADYAYAMADAMLRARESK